MFMKLCSHMVKATRQPIFSQAALAPKGQETISLQASAGAGGIRVPLVPAGTSLSFTKCSVGLGRTWASFAFGLLWPCLAAFSETLAFGIGFGAFQG